MDLLLIAFCLLMSAALTLAGMELNRILASRSRVAALAASAGIPPVANDPSAGPAATAATGHR